MGILTIPTADFSSKMGGGLKLLVMHVSTLETTCRETKRPVRKVPSIKGLKKLMARSECQLGGLIQKSEPRSKVIIMILLLVAYLRHLSLGAYDPALQELGQKS